MHKIGEDVIREVSGQVSGLLSDYEKEINEAYLKASNSLSIDLSVKFSPEDGGGVFVETGLSFIRDRVKAKTSGSVGGQMKLDLEGPRETDEPARLCPVQGERVRESYCYEKCDLRLEVLAPDPENHPDFLQARPCAAHADEWTAFCVQMMLKWESPPYYAADPPAPDEVERAGESMLDEGSFPVVDAEWPPDDDGGALSAAEVESLQQAEDGTTDERTPGDDIPVDATYMFDGMKCMLLSPKEYKALNVSYSGDILGDGLARRPFSYSGEQRITQSMLHSPVPGESYADTWRLVPPKEFEGEIFSHDEIRAQYDDGSRNRGDLTGMVVTCQGQQYVLDAPLRFYLDNVSDPLPEPEPEMATYRIFNRKINGWWEGKAPSAQEALSQAGWSSEVCEIKIGGPGAWRKCHELDEKVPCDGCSNHRRRGNSKKGVTIPGVYGKCIRDGGPCELMADRMKVEAAA